MRREEAIQLVQTMIKICENDPLTINSISLIAPLKDNQLIGYQLEIGTTLSEHCRRVLTSLLIEKDLEMEEKKDSITIFKSH